MVRHGRNGCTFSETLGTGGQHQDQPFGPWLRVPQVYQRWRKGDDLRGKWKIGPVQQNWRVRNTAKATTEARSDSDGGSSSGGRYQGGHSQAWKDPNPESPMFAETEIFGSQSHRSHHSHNYSPKNGLGRIYEEDSVEENQEATAMAFMEGAVEGKNHESLLQEKNIKEGSRTRPDGKMLEVGPEKTKSEDPPGRFMGTWDSKKGQMQWQNLGDGLHEVQLDWDPKASSYFPKVKLWFGPATNTCPPTSPQTRVQLLDPHNVPSRIFPLKEPLHLSVHEVGAENTRSPAEANQRYSKTWKKRSRGGHRST